MKNTSTQQKFFGPFHLITIFMLSVFLITIPVSAQVIASGGTVDIKNLGEWTKMTDIVIKETSKNDIKGSMTILKYELIIDLPEGFTFDLTRTDVSYMAFGNITSIIIDKLNTNPKKLNLTANIHSGNFNTLDEVVLKNIYIKADQFKLYTKGEYNVVSSGDFPGLINPLNIGKIYMQAKPMPVELLYLTADKRDNHVVLQWATATEDNNTGFEVQVSQDGSSYRKIAFVETKNGNARTKQKYEYTDTENGKYGTRYYRLKQLDTNGEFTYYSIKAVEFGDVAYSVKVYPNPFKSNLKLSITTPEMANMQLSVLSSQGKMVTNRSLLAEKGLNSFNLDLDPNLTKGLYFVTLAVGNQVSRFKVLKE